MKLFPQSAIAALGLATPILSLATFSPLDPSPGPTFKVGLPTGSSITNSAAGDIYFQLSAPSSYRWVGLGLGDAMAHAEIFVMYADGNGNVTISARNGNQGHVQPLVDSSLAEGVTLLEGSGIANGVMTANVKCSTCKLAASDIKSSPFISAWQIGSGIDSTSTSATITQHDLDSYRQFSFDLSTASIASDTNPFVAAAPAASTSPSASATGKGSATGSGTSATGTGVSATVTGSGAVSSTASAASPSASSGSHTGSSSGDSGVVSSAGPTASAHTIITYQKAHGIIMGVTVVLLFPLGAIFQRLVGTALIHGALQIFALAMLLVGFGLGIKLGHLRDLLYKSAGRTHTIFGTVILALFLIQPFLGLAHHHFYKRDQARTSISHVHIWFGRIIIILAVINGGLGLKLAANTHGGEIAYGVVAGVVAVVYAATVLFKRKGSEGSLGRRREKESVELRSRDGHS